MRMMFPLIGLMLGLIPPLAAQTPADSTADELRRENKELRAYIEKLEEKIRRLDAQLKERKQPPAPLFKMPSPLPLPFQFHMIPPPGKPAIPPGRPATRPFIVPPQPPVPPGARRFEFNGMDVFIIPLR